MGSSGVAHEDKAKIAFYAAMMSIQNFGFFLMYFLMFLVIPNPDGGTCEGLRFWIGFFSLDCFVESFVCVWMGMAGFIDERKFFIAMWILHLVVALPYCICTVGIPINIYSEDGKACREVAGAPLFPLVPVFCTHASLFLVYVVMMLSITYYSFLKPLFFGKVKVAEDPA
eukprot:gb/GFBE01052708.1/.p1 GENE.gb/GFBE01052708.1/~~gb/GFBE01052708.1/.p1  ORF type:complete len:170 (+),score=37.59 gb/GFBE01052708.1/:1-510(+)